jgi:RNA polymerase sigma factor (sigma-70 family)
MDMSFDPSEIPSLLERDRALLAAWKARDQQAGEELVGHYHLFLLRLCSKAGLRSKEDQEEICQDVMVRIMEVLPKLKIEVSFSRYLERVFISVLSRRRKPAFAALPAQVSGGEDPPDPIEGEEIQFAILNCEKKLKKNESFVLKARIFEKASYPAIASSLKMNIGNLYTIYGRAREKMRICLKKKGFGLDY